MFLDRNNRMTDSNAQSNWTVPKAKKTAKNGILHYSKITKRTKIDTIGNE